MQDVVSLTSLYEKTSRSFLNSETDFDISSKVTIADAKQQQRVASRLPLCRSDSEANQKIKDRHQKQSKYDPPMSDRESWWRVTVKVRLKLLSGYFYMQV